MIIKKSDLNIINENDILVSEPTYITEDIKELKSLSNILFDKIEDLNCISASFPQFGKNIRMFCLLIHDFKLMMYEPKIINRSLEMDFFEENTLRYPKLRIPVKRHENIEVEYTDEKFSLNVEKFSGITSFVIQQMIDYCNGISLKKKVSPTKWNFYFKKAYDNISK